MGTRASRRAGVSPHGSLRSEIKSTLVVEIQDSPPRSPVAPFLRRETKDLVEFVPSPVTG